MIFQFALYHECIDLFLCIFFFFSANMSFVSRVPCLVVRDGTVMLSIYSFTAVTVAQMQNVHHVSNGTIRGTFGARCREYRHEPDTDSIIID